MKAHWMLRLYPRAWRNRYEQEFRALLDEVQVSASDLVDILMGAAYAQIQYRQLPDNTVLTSGMSDMHSQHDYRHARNRVRMIAALYVHAALFIVVNLFLLAINLLTIPDTLWFLYPLWGWGMLLTAHAGVILRGRALFAAHALLFALLNGGLAWINLSTSDAYWFYWPLINTAILLLAHALIAFNITGFFGAHVAVTGLAAGELGAITYLYVAHSFGSGASNDWTLWATWSLVSLLLAHALLRIRRAGWLSSHVLLFVMLNAQFVLQDLLYSDERWFQYPLAGWAIVLGAHVAIRMGLLPSFDREWEQRKRQDLMRLSGLDGETGDLAAGEIERRAWHLRLLNLHILAFAVAALALIVLNAMTQPSDPWAIWPLWVWGIALGAHAGYIVFRRSLLGAHAIFFLTVNIGLVTIDMVYSDTRWFFWPLAGGTLLLLGHVALSQETRKAVRAWEQRRIASMLD